MIDTHIPVDDPVHARLRQQAASAEFGPIPRTASFIPASIRTPQMKLVGAKTVWQEAREQIDAWEQEEPEAANLVLILDGAKDACLTVAGPAMKPSAAAGLCLYAAQMAVGP